MVSFENLASFRFYKLTSRRESFGSVITFLGLLSIIITLSAQNPIQAHARLFVNFVNCFDSVQNKSFGQFRAPCN